MSRPDDDAICPGCSGSGEGQHEGTLCITCGGSGNDRKPWGRRDEPNPDDARDEQLEQERRA